jgi:hypothetical protein
MYETIEDTKEVLQRRKSTKEIKIMVTEKYNDI